MGKTIVSLIIMLLASFAGLFVGGMLGDTLGGMILLALISGIACIIYTIESKQ